MGRTSADLDHSSRPTAQALANDYDSFAEAYAIETESNLINGAGSSGCLGHRSGAGRGGYGVTAWLYSDPRSTKGSAGGAQGT